MRDIKQKRMYPRVTWSSEKKGKMGVVFVSLLNTLSFGNWKVTFQYGSLNATNFWKTPDIKVSKKYFHTAAAVQTYFLKISYTTS